MKTIDCPHCQDTFNFRQTGVGKLYRCRGCRGRIEFFYRKDDKPAFPHGMHLILTLFTCGMWAAAWPVAWLTTICARAVQENRR